MSQETIPFIFFSGRGAKPNSQSLKGRAEVIQSKLTQLPTVLAPGWFYVTPGFCFELLVSTTLTSAVRDWNLEQDVHFSGRFVLQELSRHHSICGFSDQVNQQWHHSAVPALPGWIPSLWKCSGSQVGAGWVTECRKLQHLFINPLASQR